MMVKGYQKRSWLMSRKREIVLQISGKKTAKEMLIAMQMENSSYLVDDSNPDPDPEIPSRIECDGP